MAHDNAAGDPAEAPEHLDALADDLDAAAQLLREMRYEYVIRRDALLLTHAANCDWLRRHEAECERLARTLTLHARECREIPKES